MAALMTRKAKRMLVFVCLSMSATAVISLTAAKLSEKNGTRDLVTNLRDLAYSRISSGVSETNATGQSKKRRNEERRADNVSKNIPGGIERATALEQLTNFLSPEEYSERPPKTLTPTGPGNSQHTIRKTNK